MELELQRIHDLFDALFKIFFRLQQTGRHKNSLEALVPVSETEAALAHLSEVMATLHRRTQSRARGTHQDSASYYPGFSRRVRQCLCDAAGFIIDR